MSASASVDPSRSPPSGRGADLVVPVLGPGRLQHRGSDGPPHMRRPGLVGDSSHTTPPGPRRPTEIPTHQTFQVRPEFRQDHPLNLSISVGGGEETNQDSPSSGERSGKSPS